MAKDFISYDTIRDNGFKLAQKIGADGFIPDVMYVSMRGGAYLGNVISEYFKLMYKDFTIRYAALVARSYSGVKDRSEVIIDGWTYDPKRLKKGDKILLVDDIFDSGETIHALVSVFIEQGIPRSDIRVVVYDYKVFHNKKQQNVAHPDYWCRKHDIYSEADDLWIHYMSHELMGLSFEELETHYFSKNPELRDVFKDIFKDTMR